MDDAKRLAAALNALVKSPQFSNSKARAAARHPSLSLALGGAGGVAWLVASELRLRAIRRGRMQPASGPSGSIMGGRPRAPSNGIGTQLMGTIRTLGQQSAVRDPAKLSVLRSQLGRQPVPTALVTGHE